jgi:putative transcriptional regulator
MKTLKPTLGSILLAQPFWNEERYKRSVIMLLEHNEHGSKGIIVNKLSTLDMNEALPELEVDLPLYYGGPSNPEIISFIHNYFSMKESFPLGNELYFDGNYEELQERIRNKRIDLKRIKFFSGFVEWNRGELEQELEKKKWWVSSLMSKEFFTTSYDELWKYKLLMDGHIYGLMEELPDPAQN